MAAENFGALKNPFGTESEPSETGDLFSRIVGLITIVGGLAMTAYLLFGAVTWISAGGDPKAVDSAKKTITNAITGIVIIVAVRIIVGILGRFLGVYFLDPSIEGPA